ncbi:hypothetical protein GCG54_00012539 [Colletotrichum gloeosporioides]|uniref:Uncharacterized protein n=1 Tax=Colletotrichum gloeosporioides TaxID=474922 RepID=A0A8H4CEI7_COLGL|nr:uncharacterized protein GCG54_00012539 [Colletotrichum gloeosporioides]KAF3802291.1 hypothetical protein GCG54_00012539 [Colletotrichum gloeosporioides]
MADVTPAAAAGRLLRTLGLPESQRQSLGLQRGTGVPAPGRCSHGVASAAVHALHCSTEEAPEAISPTISLELEAWPSEPSTPSTAESSECDSVGPSTIPPALRRRYSHYSPLGRLRGHSRTNSLDSTASIASSSSTSSTRSRWNIFAPVLDELTASNHRSDYASDKKSRQSREVWREYCGFTKFRAGLTAAGCAAIIFTGATYGAGLKTQEEWTEERQKFHGSPYDEQIALLEGQRIRLLSERRNWERKSTALEERIRARGAKKSDS